MFGGARHIATPSSSLGASASSLHSGSNGRRLSPPPSPSFAAASLQSGVGGRRKSKRVGSLRRPDRQPPLPPRLHPLRLGDPAKTYSRHDRVSPVVDSIRRMFIRTGSLGVGAHAKHAAFELKMEREQAANEQGARAVRALKPADPKRITSPIRDGEERRSFEQDVAGQHTLDATLAGTVVAPVCTSCGTNNPANFSMSNCNRRVCSYCGAMDKVESYNLNYGEAHPGCNKDRQHVGTVNSPARRFATECVDITKKKNHTAGKHPEHGALAGGSTKVPERYRAAQLKCNASAGTPPAGAGGTASPPFALKGRHSKKLGAILEEVDNLIVEMSSTATIEEAVAVELRRNTNDIYTRALTHSRYCQSETCEMALYNKPARVIALKCFQYTVFKLSSGTGVSFGITKARISQLDLQVQQSQTFTQRENAVSNEACFAMISTIDAAEQVCVPCVEAAVASAHAGPPGATVADGGTESCATDCKRKNKKGFASLKSQNTSFPKSAFIVQVGDAVYTLSKEMHYPPFVRDAAMGTLEVREFTNLLSESAIVPAASGKFGAAFVLLEAVKETLGAKDGPKTRTERNVQRAMLHDADMSTMIAEMRVAMPPLVAAVDDDDLLY